MNFFQNMTARLFKKPAATLQKKIYTKDQHKIDKRLVSRNAIKVCDVLQSRGFEAYIVGGAVRDLLLGLEPKDFDVATSATPEEVKDNLRRAQIIGRRFRLVHVRFGREIIETSTFRMGNDTEKMDEHGRLLSDNSFGTLEQDAERRDFTINALYYDPIKEEVLDFQSGLEDVRARIVRMIGEPKKRYTEDPVRILRAIRFASKLNGTIEDKTFKAIAPCAELINHVPDSRLFDENLKLAVCGDVLKCLKLLTQAGIPKGTLTLPDLIREKYESSPFVQLAIERTDQRARARKTVSPSFLYAALLWPDVKEQWELKSKHLHRVPALIEAGNQVLDEYSSRLTLQKRHSSEMREIWFFQPRFEKYNRKSIYSLVEQRRFRAAVDFLQIRAASHEFDSVDAQWWMDLADADSGQRENLIQEIAKTKNMPAMKRSSKSPRRRRRRKSAAARNAAQTQQTPQAE